MPNKLTPGGMIAVKHQWPASPTYWDGQQQGFYNLDTFVTIDKAPENSYYFWAQQFWFIGGDGGYIGLQPVAILMERNGRLPFSRFGTRLLPSLVTRRIVTQGPSAARERALAARLNMTGKRGLNIVCGCGKSPTHVNLPIPNGGVLGLWI